MKSKVVLFDWSGLLDNNIIVNKHMVEYWDTILDLRKKGLSDEFIAETIDRMYRKGHVLHNMDKWVFPEVARYIKEIFAEFRLKPNFDMLTSANKNLYCLATMRPVNQDYLDKLMSLKGKYEVGILANCNQYDLIALESNIDLGNVDHKFISCLMHERMGSARFYFEVQERLCRPLKDTLFVTMDPKHADKANAIGWQVCLIDERADASLIDKLVEELM